MLTPKNKVRFVLSHSAILAVAFALTAWKALDEQEQIKHVLRNSLTVEQFCTLDFPRLIAGCESRFIFPSGQDLVNRQLLNTRVRAQVEPPLFNQTLTNAIFPTAGDILRIAVDVTSPAINFFTPPGGGQIWDFSSLSADQKVVTHFQPASVGSGFSNYPGADLVTINSAGIETYYNVTTSDFSLMGQSGYSLLAGLPIYMHLNYNPSIQERWSPTEFFGIFASSSGILEGWAISEFPSGFFNCIPSPPDSLRLRMSVNKLSTVDAWGSLTIPGGTYDVLRIKSTTYSETRLDAKIAPLGWLDITDIGIQNCGLPDFGVDTLVKFDYFNNNVKEPIATVFMDASQSFAVKVEFKDLGSCLKVSSVANTGAGSLREAIACSMAGDTIRFEPAVHQQTISLDLPTIVTAHPLTLYAEPAQQVTISNFNAANTGTLLSIQDRLSIHGLKITGQTAESMILKLEPSGYLQLNNGEISKVTVNKN